MTSCICKASSGSQLVWPSSQDGQDWSWKHKRSPQCHIWYLSSLSTYFPLALPLISWQVASLYLVNAQPPLKILTILWQPRAPCHCCCMGPSPVKRKPGMFLLFHSCSNFQSGFHDCGMLPVPVTWVLVFACWVNWCKVLFFQLEKRKDVLLTWSMTRQAALKVGKVAGKLVWEPSEFQA